MALKQPVGRKKTQKIAAILGGPVVKAFVNGDLPHGVAVAYATNGNVYFVNLKKKKARCFIREGKVVLHRVIDGIKRLPEPDPEPRQGMKPISEMPEYNNPDVWEITEVTPEEQDEFLHQLHKPDRVYVRSNDQDEWSCLT